MQKSWYMIYTRQNSEKRICALFKRKKIESFCPLNHRQIEYFGKTKFLSSPLFGSCVFARLGKDDFYILNKLKNVLTIVYWKDKPAVIQNEEIETIKEFVRIHHNIKLEKSNVGFTSLEFTNSPTYTINRNSVSVDAGLIRVKLPSLGFIISAETERKNVFKRSLSVLPDPTYLSSTQ
ncbi:MAG: transcription termination/antitermination NusG family protein [Ginsengibacter sp.]